MSRLRILRCGPHCSIQDEGRPGVARLGLAPAGAMDRRALHLANRLVGNQPGVAAIEIAWGAFQAEAEGGAVTFALAGAAAEVKVDGRRVATNRTFTLAAGERFSVGRPHAGVFCVLAVAGGIDVAEVLGSRSFDAAAAIGGLAGRALAAGDVVPLPKQAAWRGPELTAGALSLDAASPFRIVMGPQDDAFGAQALQLLESAEFSVSLQSNRMAMRLEGVPLVQAMQRDMISDATLSGSIQVPPDGMPLVLMRDRQTIGGYPKIATVIEADLSRLAQQRPGARVRFRVISAREAIEIRRQLALAQNDLVPAAGPYDSIEQALREAGVGDAVTDALDASAWDRGLARVT